ncbi:MAG: SUMF1/EgtB/PvdO family nonheme iron enzyme [Spirochaetaceae bacterium]|jgi:hypothetical protein|nr:SUMF1/EgtB/PvdO family nonheme iron enzyme [Spirochaetaceae bacterium]
MAFFSRKPIEILAEDEVRLKAALGIRPEVYVTVLCAFLVAAALFFLLFFPGLANPGSVVAFRSEPSGAAVSVDGVYAGQTPCDVFTARGGRTITMTMAGFRGGSAALTVESRVFGSLFFPRRGTVRLTLEEESPNAALLEGAREFAAWSFTAEPTEVYQIPLVLSEGAYRSGAGDEAARRGARDILAGAARFTQAKAGMKDLIRAVHLSGNGGNAPSPLSLVSSIQDALSFLQDNPASAAWLAAVLPSEARETALQSGWYAASEQDGPASARLSDIPATETVTLIVEGVTFIRSGDNLWAATTPVTAAQFARFTEANPEWREENASTLAERGLATIDYLVTVEDTRYPAPTVSGVSWYAAEAYCRWLSARLPASLSGWTAALPSEAQWDEAASTAGVEGTGTIWEWCADPYAPFPALGATQTVIAQIGSPEKLVRGANWTRPKRNGQKALSRGSVPPESSTPFVSFRPVLERRK